MILFRTSELAYQFIRLTYLAKVSDKCVYREDSNEKA